MVARPELHIISNGQQTLDEFTRVVQQVAPFVDVVHLREKKFHARQTFTALQQLTSVIPIDKIAVNDRLDAALASGVKRVQLAWHSLPVDAVKRTWPQLTIGCSVHAVSEAVEAERQGADYVIYGHIYPTGSKPGLIPRGLMKLQEVVRAVNIPVIAIGGIEPRHVKEVLATGATGIAVMSGICEAVNPALVAKEYAARMNNL